MLRVSFSSSMRVRINHVVCLIRTWRRSRPYIRILVHTYTRTYGKCYSAPTTNSILSPMTIFRRRDIERNWTERPRGLKVVCCIVHTMVCYLSISSPVIVVRCLG
ncbi:hypothetical protein M431DRAFT_315088 [Trichoderma harzianum CBS 226.95]|uniref:Uncharacterized protein n=1 Tax=Trichoderma harzianum CBS 226.95 TaxID=983964 RepID=A0A2T4ARU0_TRIHA|nr:hypothetical protein M431DRAFT_315088 [Trichoderma harzianum CBS 226.95]PTB59794.1 hypothetical protein M431DRAFT_315088 [Trichoderma harzianum CBS 226.95]